MQNMHNQSVVVLWHYTITVKAAELKTYPFYIKTSILDLFFVFNAIDSPDIISSNKQPKCYFDAGLHKLLSFMHQISYKQNRFRLMSVLVRNCACKRADMHVTELVLFWSSG